MKHRLTLLLCWAAALVAAQEPGGQLRFAIDYEPRSLNPLAVEDQASELLRFLTAGTLVRVNRTTQQVEPGLATAWKAGDGSRTVAFTLREGVRFSDGTPFDSADVAHTVAELMRPELRSATADAFRSGSAPPKVQVSGRHSISVTFSAPVAEIVRMFDQVPIVSSRSPKKELATLGPFSLVERKSGSYLLLHRNPHFWKSDAKGRRLPYLDSIRIQIQPNRELEALAFRRGELDLLTRIDPVLFENLAREHKSSLRDLGPALDSEFLWFNQVRNARIAEHKKKWFRSTAFRQAISAAVHREDICRIVYRGHARPASGPHPPTNALWYHSKLQPVRFDPARALRTLQAAGFRMDAQTLRDADGNAVAFSLLTNAGNKSRERIAAMIQRDLKAIGIQVSLVMLDFPSLLERMMRTYDYDACLLGLVNVGADPNEMMNVWLSSSSNHQWNPKQASPETPWEAEIDKHMKAQASLPDQKARRTHWHRVLELVYEQQPFIYLLHPNALAAVGPHVRNAASTPLRPQTLAHVETMYFDRRAIAKR